MNLIFLVASIVCGLIAAASSFGWFDLSANAYGFLALAVVFLAAAALPWGTYFRR